MVTWRGGNAEFALPTWSFVQVNSEGEYETVLEDHSKHWKTWNFETLPRLVPGTKLRFEKLDFIQEFAVPVPQANKKFPQTATVVARTAKRSIRVRFEEDRKNSYYTLKEA